MVTAEGSMPDLSACDTDSSEASTGPLPIASIVRALCQAAEAGPDKLYEVMLKLSLVVEQTAPMYGLSLWRVDHGQKAKLSWAEGLDDSELQTGEQLVNDLLMPGSAWPMVKQGDSSVCLVLASSTQSVNIF